MRVLWITNIIFPVPCDVLGLPLPVYGGWMMSSLEALKSSHSDIEFAVATVYGGKRLEICQSNNVKYYLLPTSKDKTIYDNSLEPFWQQIKEDFRPDVVHIHGTEFAHGLAYIKSCGADNVCLSIQGLVSICARYYYAGMSVKDIWRNLTIRDLLKSDTIFQQKKNFERRGKIEKEYIKLVSHVVGRTSWDKAQIWAVNPDARYYLCNETLRPSFYNHVWSYSQCDKHTIFLSQAAYPLKGLHKVLEAIPLILREFPDVHVRIAGDDIVSQPFYRRTGYGKYICSLIRNFNLDGKITFLGTLSEEQMCLEYLRANVFICPSSIENSPNSLGEAQLLGVPHLASCVGGVGDMMQGNENCVYRFEEVEMLAEKVCDIFRTTFEEPVSSYNCAAERHDPTHNAQELVNIYKAILRKF